MESFPIGSGAAKVAGCLQTEPDTEAREHSNVSAGLLINLRKGEPKVT
jgi:hypothetical protein